MSINEEVSKTTIASQSLENLIGSPEWFRRRAQNEKILNWSNETEKYRYEFLKEYSYEELTKMSGEKLMNSVFGPGRSMMRILREDSDYVRFGYLGSQGAIGFIYIKNGNWTYIEKKNAITLTREEAIEKAEEIRDSLLECVRDIEETELNSMQGYAILDEKLSEVAFSKYVWALKYYQMCFPQYFPCMYSLEVQSRALGILGLPDHRNQVLNAGEISLFIRKCNISNIAFGRVYGDQWGWEKNMPAPAPAASSNYNRRSEVMDEANLYYYRLPNQVEKQNNEDEQLINDLEEDLDIRDLEGKDRLAVVKVRINQGTFRDKLLSRYSKCCLCGVSDPHFLVASHIKPWSECDPNEKLDVDNGLLLCPGHDKLFDLGYISFDDSGKTIISDKLSKDDMTFLNVQPGRTIELHGNNRKYLEFHRLFFGFEK